MHFGKIMYVASSRKRNFNPLIHCAGVIFACQVGSMTGNAMCRKQNILFCSVGMVYTQNNRVYFRREGVI
jgi:hypothetical protein